VGKISPDTHPKDAEVKVDANGLITEIVEGKFLDDPKPDLQKAIDAMAETAEKKWLAVKDGMAKRPQLSGREDRVERTELQLGGFGGQGIISAGKIIGQAAAIYDKLEACFTQSYGPEARGGAAGSQVVISSEPIHYPNITEPGSAVIMSQGAYAKYAPLLATGGILLVDNSLVELPDDHRTDIITHGIPATQVAEELGNIRAANTVMLGFWASAVGAVSREAMQHSLSESVPPKTVDVNLKAFDYGYQEGVKIAI